MKPTGHEAEASDLYGQEAQRVRTARLANFDFSTSASLRMRRAWYAEGEGEGDKPNPDKPDGDGKPDKTDDKRDPLDAWIETLPKEAQAGAMALVTELRQTRTEAKNRRLAAEAADKEKADADAKRQKEEKDKLAEQGKWEEVAANQAKEIEGLKTFKTEADELRTTLQAMLDKRLETVPEHLRPLVKQMKLTEALTWLDANADKLNPKAAPGGDGGKKGDQQTPPPDKTEVMSKRKARY